MRYMNYYFYCLPPPKKNTHILHKYTNDLVVEEEAGDTVWEEEDGSKSNSRTLRNGLSSFNPCIPGTLEGPTWWTWGMLFQRAEWAPKCLLQTLSA